MNLEPRSAVASGRCLPAYRQLCGVWHLKKKQEETKHIFDMHVLLIKRRHQNSSCIWNVGDDYITSIESRQWSNLYHSHHVRTTRRGSLWRCSVRLLETCPVGQNVLTVCSPMIRGLRCPAQNSLTSVRVHTSEYQIHTRKHPADALRKTGTCPHQWHRHHHNVVENIRLPTRTPRLYGVDV